MTRAAALLEAIALYRGQVAHGHEHVDRREADEVWLAPHCDEYFHKLVDAHTDAAALLRVSDPDRAIDLLERAARLEPWNNALSEQIIEIHVEQGRHHAAARRLAVLTEHLAAHGMRPNARLTSFGRRGRCIGMRLALDDLGGIYRETLPSQSRPADEQLFVG